MQPSGSFHFFFVFGFTSIPLRSTAAWSYRSHTRIYALYLKYPLLTNNGQQTHSTDMDQDIAKVAEGIKSIMTKLDEQEELIDCVVTQEAENTELIEKILFHLTAPFAISKKEMQSLDASLIHEFSEDLFAAYTHFMRIHRDKHPFVQKCKGAF